ncbi:MAG: sigma-70 family RNA polymerase sigma factor [Planctomycetes bacterium]|nr:sigma-70 family RNA polymerase sigma factor [Planctomycetota bacterium]
MGRRVFDTTSLGGNTRGFPETTWGLISRLGDHDSTDSHTALQSLCLKYWKPVYLYMRRAWAKCNEDAKDLTQAFFLWLMEGDTLSRYAPERGSFRRFIKVLLRRFVGHHERALQCLKRGGGIHVLPLDDLAALDRIVADPRAPDPETLFDREWMNTLVQHAMERVRQHFAAGGREGHFKMFESHDLVPPAERPSYSALASQFGVSVPSVRNVLFAVREALRGELRKELAELTREKKDFDEEWEEFFGERESPRTTP